MLRIFFKFAIPSTFISCRCRKTAHPANNSLLLPFGAASCSTELPQPSELPPALRSCLLPFGAVSCSPELPPAFRSYLLLCLRVTLPRVRAILAGRVNPSQVRPTPRRSLPCTLTTGATLRKLVNKTRAILLPDPTRIGRLILYLHCATSARNIV